MQPWGVKAGLWGAATPGTVVELGSPYGTGRAVATDKGEWQMIVELEMPAGTKATVVLEATGTDKRHEFVIERPGEAPAAHSFTAALDASFLDHEPPEQWFHGTGKPGSLGIPALDHLTAPVIGQSTDIELSSALLLDTTEDHPGFGLGLMRALARAVEATSTATPTLVP